MGPRGAFLGKADVEVLIAQGPTAGHRGGPVSCWGSHCWSSSEAGTGTDGSGVQPQRAAVACVTSVQNFITELDVLRSRWKLHFALLCCSWAANRRAPSTADLPSSEAGRRFKFLTRPHAAVNAGKSCLVFTMVCLKRHV